MAPPQRRLSPWYLPSISVKEAAPIKGSLQITNKVKQIHGVEGSSSDTPVIYIFPHALSKDIRVAQLSFYPYNNTMCDRLGWEKLNGPMSPFPRELHGWLRIWTQISMVLIWHSNHYSTFGIPSLPIELQGQTWWVYFYSTLWSKYPHFVILFHYWCSSLGFFVFPSITWDVQVTQCLNAQSIPVFFWHKTKAKEKKTTHALIWPSNHFVRHEQKMSEYQIKCKSILNHNETFLIHPSWVLRKRRGRQNLPDNIHYAT